MNRKLKRICENLNWSVWDCDKDIELHKLHLLAKIFSLQLIKIIF